MADEGGQRGGTPDGLPVVRTLDGLTDLVARHRGLYVRWSRGPGTDLAEASSTDELTGVAMPGLSASPLDVEEWWADRPVRVWAARRLHDYAHLPHDRGPGVRPWVLTGREAGRGPDNEPLVTDARPMCGSPPRSSRRPASRWNSRNAPGGRCAAPARESRAGAVAGADGRHMPGQTGGTFGNGGRSGTAPAGPPACPPSPVLPVVPGRDRPHVAGRTRPAVIRPAPPAHGDRSDAASRGVEPRGRSAAPSLLVHGR